MGDPIPLVFTLIYMYYSLLAPVKVQVRSKTAVEYIYHPLNISRYLIFLMRALQRKPHNVDLWTCGLVDMTGLVALAAPSDIVGNQVPLESSPLWNQSCPFLESTLSLFWNQPYVIMLSLCRPPQLLLIED